jgi:uncharacterized membrane protein YbhN (UPF0104 family)/tRNA A-37 threonylcarbamoyl transferase component Bud32
MNEPLLPAPPPIRRRFSPGDILRVLIGLGFLVVGLLLATVAKETLSGVESDVVEAVSRLPDEIEHGVIATAQLLATLFPLAVLLLVIWRRNWRLLVSLFAASVLASVATQLIERWLGVRESVNVLAERAVVGSWLIDPNFPSTSYLAAAAAWVAAGTPWLPVRWRRAAWWWIALLVVLRVVGSGDPALDVVLAVALGVVLGTLVLLVAGSPNQEPDPAELLASLRAAGMDPSVVERVPGIGRASAFLVTERQGSVAQVKLRTPHDRSADLLERLYQAVRLRSSEISPPFSTLKRRVEHEALMLASSRAAGARTLSVLSVGTTPSGSAFIVTDQPQGVIASELDTVQLTSVTVRDFWVQLGALHRARIAHRAPGLDRIAVDLESEEVCFVDLDEADLAALPRDRARDIAVALVDLALSVGAEAAVSSALDVEGIDVTSALPLLQPLALPSPVRARLRADKSVLEKLRIEIQEQTGAPLPELDRLERFSTRTVVMIVAAALAFYALLPQLASIDTTIEAFGEAEPIWIPAILGAGAVTYVFATVSLLGSVGIALPFLASLRASVATAFASLVGPATTGRMALSVRFLQRAGLDSADASASVVLNSVAGLVTHLLLMFSFFAWTGSSSIGGFSLPEANTVLLLLAVVAAVLTLAAVLGPIRRRILAPAGRVARQAGGYVALVVQSPIRVLALLGGSSLITLSYVAALVFSIEAFGGGIAVPQIAAAYLGAAAIANLAPTPGGLGALEAAMIAALTGFGLEDGTAISSVLAFRLGTFWLPIIPGWLAFRWMQNNDEL